MSNIPRVEYRASFCLPTTKSRLVPKRIYMDGWELAGDYGSYEDTLWVERDEDMYAMSSRQLRGKRVLVVTRRDWLASPEVT